MSPKTLKSGAILIADAHCAPWRTSFIDFLKALDEGQVMTSQLILLGDILDMLYGTIPATYRYNTDVIELLNRLSQRIEIIFLEGNHDFILQRLFPNIMVVPRRDQPLSMSYGECTVALSHGDKRIGRYYELYTLLIRNPLILAGLRFIDFMGKGFIIRWLEKMMREKKHCREIKNFEKIVFHRFAQMDIDQYDVWIEGHFHQNKRFTLQHLTYINLGAFACNERYFAVQSNQNQLVLCEEVFVRSPNEGTR